MLHDYYAPSELKTELKGLNYGIEPIVDIMGNRIEDLRLIPLSTNFNYERLLNRSKEWSETFVRLATDRSKEVQMGILQIMDRIILPQKQYFAVIIGNEIVGIVLGVLERRYLGIMDLIVDPAYRRQGVASSLLNMTLKWAKSYGCTHIFLQVVRENQKAVSLYQKINLKKWYSYFYMKKE